MKYLILLSILLTSCATSAPRDRSVQADLAFCNAQRNFNECMRIRGY